MKTRIFTTGLLLAVCQSFTGTCMAFTPVEENFNSKTLNAARWQLAQFENAKLVQANKRLNFTVGPKTAEEDYAYVELRNNQPGYNENWQAILDVSNTANAGNEVGAGFWIFNADNPTNVLFFEFYGKEKGKQGGFQASFVKDGFGNYLEPHLISNPRVKHGSMRITFNKETKIFTFFFDKNGSGNGYQWERIGTFSTNGIGGDRRLNWNMNPASGRFGIRLEAFGEKTLVGGGRVNMDNFALKALK